MANKNIDIDIIYDYLVQGDSQQTIADNYGFNQREISNILTKEYGLNKGNTAWGTGRNNQKGRYSHLSYEDIEDFVYSGSNDIDDWLANRYGDSDGRYDDYNDYDDYDSDEDYPDNDNYDNKPIFNKNPINTGHRDNRPEYRPKRNTNTVSSFDWFNLFDGKFGTILLLGLLVVVLSILVKIKTILQMFPSYLKLLWNGKYVFFMFGLAFVNLAVRLFVKHETIREILDEPRIYYWLGAGFILAGVKLLFDMGFAVIWPGAIPIALGLGIIVFIKWLMDN